MLVETPLPELVLNTLAPRMYSPVAASLTLPEIVWACAKESIEKVDAKTKAQIKEKYLAIVKTNVHLIIAMFFLISGCSDVKYDDCRVFRYNESAGITTLDPAHSRSLELMWVVDQIYDGLVELDEELNIRPAMLKVGLGGASMVPSELAYEDLGRELRKARLLDRVLKRSHIRSPQIWQGHGYKVLTNTSGEATTIDGVKLPKWGSQMIKP